MAKKSKREARAAVQRRGGRGAISIYLIFRFQKEEEQFIRLHGQTQKAAYPVRKRHLSTIITATGEGRWDPEED